MAYPYDWKEERRWRAWELKQAHWKQRMIAKALGVSEAAVSQWFKAVRERGRDTLHAKPRPGATPKLTKAHLQLLPDCLSHGAEAYGFRGEVWTCARVAKMIEYEFGVIYHKAHVSRLLKQLAWTPQKPMVRAAQRAEALIAYWHTDIWPALKKRRRRRSAPLFLRMNLASTCCPAW